VVGIFEAGHYEFDSALAFVHIEDAAHGAPAAPAGLRLRIADMHQAPLVAAELKKSMSGDLVMRDWSKLNANWFAAVQTEKRMMFIILTLIIAVAAFNLVSTLVMTVTDKQADIAILRTLGASPRSIMKIFMIQGALVGLLGTCWAWLRRAGGAEHRRHRALHRAPAGRAVPVQGYLPDQRDAVGPALAGRFQDRRRGRAAGLCGDALPELVGVARQTGGGAAL
jgi:hypothetical protein